MVEDSDKRMQGGPRRASPERTCILTRAELPPADLIRFVVDPESVVVADVAGRLPGRGAWLTATRAAVEKAMAAKIFEKAFRRRVTVPPDLPSTVQALLQRRVLEALSLANKAGFVTTGFTKVESDLRSGKVAVLIHASDAARDGVDKLDRLYRAVAEELGQTPRIESTLDSSQISLALGRSNVIHAALKHGGATAAFLGEARRLSRFREGPYREGPSPSNPDPDRKCPAPADTAAPKG